jgi:hypothetical protein
VLVVPTAQFQFRQLKVRATRAIHELKSMADKKGKGTGLV